MTGVPFLSADLFLLEIGELDSVPREAVLHFREVLRALSLRLARRLPDCLSATDWPRFLRLPDLDEQFFLRFFSFDGVSPQFLSMEPPPLPVDAHLGEATDRTSRSSLPFDVSFFFLRSIYSQDSDYRRSPDAPREYVPYQGGFSGEKEPFIRAPSLSILSFLFHSVVTRDILRFFFQQFAGVFLLLGRCRYQEELNNPSWTTGACFRLLDLCRTRPRFCDDSSFRTETFLVPIFQASLRSKISNFNICSGSVADHGTMIFTWRLPSSATFSFASLPTCSFLR